MSTRELHVYLDGELCGLLQQTQAGNLTFSYDDSYRTGVGPTSLSLSMPTTVKVHKKRVVLPFLQGLLPDSEEALRAIARRFSVSPKNPFGMLEYVGADVAGAVQICCPGDGPSDQVLPRNDVRRASKSEVVKMLDHAVTEYADGTPYDDSAGRFSLAGAQPKIALHRMVDGALRQGQVEGQGQQARAVADDLLSGLVKLPLVEA